MPVAGAPEDRLAAFVAGLGPGDVPAEVRHEARRALVNVFATALAGSREPAVAIALETERAFAAPGACTLIGRAERVAAPLAAYLNAMAANLHDFDDTHEATIIHPAAPVFAAVFAEAGLRRVTGAALVTALVAGIEAECRIGNAISPGHYARGWHITATCGGIGAAAGVGVLLGLDAHRMRHAFAIAAQQAGGLVEALGTMAKSAGVGAAARNGFLAAHLARNGFTGPAAPLSGPHGFLQVFGEAPDPGALTGGLGARWEIAANTYKPWPVGVVLNPVIDACLALRAEGLRPADVARVELTGHPLLRQRTDRPVAATGRETQVSAQHAIAVVLETGRAGLAEFTDAAAQRTLAAGRPQVGFIDDPGRGIASVTMVVHLRAGPPVTRTVVAASGSRANPLTDAGLGDKFAALAAHARFPGDVAGLADALWSLDDAPDAGAVMALAGV